MTSHIIPMNPLQEKDHLHHFRDSSTSAQLTRASMIPRVKFQDENSNNVSIVSNRLQKSRLPLQKRVSVPSAGMDARAYGIQSSKDSSMIQTDLVLREVTNTNTNTNTKKQQPNHEFTELSGKLKAMAVCVDPSETATLRPHAAHTRLQSMLPALSVPRVVPALTRVPSASTTEQMKRQANSLFSSGSQGASRFGFIKTNITNLKKSSITTSVFDKRSTKSAVPEPTISMHSGVQTIKRNSSFKTIAPAAPKMSATQRRRTQIPTLNRANSQTTRRLVPTTSMVKMHQGPTIPVGSMFDSQPFHDANMHIDSKSDHECLTSLMDTDADIWSSQDDFDTDPTLVTEYQAEIFAYKKELEIIHLPDPNYMSRQHDLSWNYRVQLIDWIIQVHDRFDLLQETMHLCVNYLDRFLSRVVIPVDQLQLAGTVALLLASKYEEIQSPAIEVLSHLGGDVHAPARIREAEIGMLKALNYDMGAPGPMSFLRRISRADNYDVDIRTLAKYLIDVTLCDHRFIGFPSSMIAAVGYCASMRLLFRGEWTAQHVHYSGYTEPMLATGINMLLVMLEQPTQTHQALFKKYNDERYMHSSQYVHGLGHSILRSLHSKILAH